MLLLDGLGRDRSNSFPVENYLKLCAGRAEMDFFVQKTGGRHAFDDYELTAHPGRIRDLFAELHQIMEAAGPRSGVQGADALPTA